jgi:hypothetical protein
MPTVRISGNWRNVNQMEWAGAPNVGPDGRIERSLAIPPDAYEAIEKAIADSGAVEGTVTLPNGTRFHYFLDR